MDKIIGAICDHSIVSFQSFNIINLPLISENIINQSLEQSLNSYLITKDKYNRDGFKCSNFGESYLSHLTSII